MFANLIKSIAAAAIVSTSLLGASATAAPWTFSTAGTITNGYDYAGVFGLGYELSGMKYVLTTVIDPDSFQYKYNYSANGYEYQSNYGSTSSPITQTVTIGSVTKTYELAMNGYNWGQSYLHSSDNFTQAYQYFSGSAANGEHISGQHSVYSYGNDFLNSISFAQNLSYQPTVNDYGYGYFNLSNAWGYSSVSFNGDKPTTLSINAQVAPVAPVDVPEPAPLALFGLGLIALAVARSKKA